MKLVTLICLLLCSIVTESLHLHKRDADHHPRLIGNIYTTMGEENYKHIVLTLLAQTLQNSGLKELEKIADAFDDLAKHCLDHGDDEECNKPMNTLFHDKVCQNQEFKERYTWSEECCSKAEPERDSCFHDHRDIEVQPYQRPDAEEICKEHAEHPHEVYHNFIFNIAIRHSNMYPLAVLAMADQYNGIVTECCTHEVKENKEICFLHKFTEAKKTADYIERKQNHICHILSSFQERVYLAIQIAHISQKHPGAKFDVVHNLVLESLHLSKDCCKGNVVECMVERMEYTEHICDNQEKLSTSLKTCCEKPLPKRTSCIIALPKDDRPADLTDEMTEYVEAEDVCEHFKNKKDDFLAKFLYDFARRNGALSKPTVLRIAKGYEELLTKCCATDHPVECYKTAPQLLEAGIKESKELTKKNCAAYEEHGPYVYNIDLLISYLQKMPQVPDKTLLEMTDKMTKIGGKCCGLPEDQRLPCAEEKLDLLLGEMCEREKKTFINKQVHHCCTESYAGRRSCFTNLGVDPEYKAPEFVESAFQVSAGICEGSEEEQKEKRFSLLIFLLKTKPDIPAEEFKMTVGDFRKMRERCCAEENKQTCFDNERQTLLDRLKKLLAH